MRVTGNAMKHGNTLMPHYDTLQKRKNMKIIENCNNFLQ